MFSLKRSQSIPHFHGGTFKMNRYQSSQQQRRRANSTSNCIIEKKRGFRPSDRFDPAKKEFLLQMGRKFFCRVRKQTCEMNEQIFSGINIQKKE